ncbi:alpha/beta hydrolase [Actinocrispum sp. NPDC049592]|uniref:alpha/beta hydrolase n=1 Tax=Actinocrispum sp. NPDC049592 TaxID=3154835 RepID=UPI003432FDD6
MTASAAEAPCQTVEVPVSTATVQGVIHGTLCTPPGATKVMVLIPGATYNSTYWDFPYQPDTYSFTLAMNRAGYATFDLDILGTGASSKHPSVLLTSFVQADAIHQVIQHLRGSFGKVILGGHSLGSAMAVLEAATYHDIDALLVTGEAHRVNAVNTVRLFSTDLSPAPLDPVLAGRGYDLTQLTTTVGQRYDAFHRPGTVDPAVIALDEQTKDAFALAAAPDAIGVAILTTYSNSINVPVMIAIGERDPYWCSLVLTFCTESGIRHDEQPYYQSAPRLDTYVLPTSGHDINLHPRAPELHAAVTTWADTVVP